MFGEKVLSKALTFVKVLLFEFIVSVVLLLITAALMYRIGFSMKTAQMIVCFIYALSTFVGGFILGKIQNSRRILWGLCAGGMYILMLLLVSILIKSSLQSDGRIIWACICSVIGGCVGGMCS